MVQTKQEDYRHNSTTSPIQLQQNQIPPQLTRLTDIAVPENPITGSSVPNVLVAGLPAASVGDLVSGSVVVGNIGMGSTTVLIRGRPAARITSQVAGVNPVTGVPVATVVGMGAPMVLMGG